MLTLLYPHDILCLHLYRCKHIKYTAGNQNRGAEFDGEWLIRLKQYCTNCGEENHDKICKHCGVKKNKSHKFCVWCATELDDSVKACPNCQEPIKSDHILKKIIRIILLVMLGLMAFNGFSEGHIIAAILFLVVFVLLLPITKTMLLELTHERITMRRWLQPIRLIAMALVFIVAAAMLPSAGGVSSNLKRAFEKQIIADLTEEFEDYASMNASQTEITTLWKIEKIAVNGNIAADDEQSVFKFYGQVEITREANGYSGDDTPYVSDLYAEYTYDAETKSFTKTELDIESGERWIDWDRKIGLD